MEPLKNQIDRGLVERYAQAVTDIDPKADVAELLACSAGLEPLELKERINLISDALARALSGGVKRQIAFIVKLSKAGFDGLDGWPIASFLERHTLDEPAAALAAMPAVTESFSCEFAIRPFLTHHFDQTMDAVMSWTTAKSEHPRRLASEGSRPRLPWGPNVPQLSADPTHGLAVLERLRHDSSEYVRRSVANHLNDVAKNDPKLVVDTTGRWAAEPETEMAMVRHALRSLVKKGDPAAMAVLGFETDAQVELVRFEVSPRDIELGDSIELTVRLRSTGDRPQKVVVDFVVHHVGANGSTSPKVFKWATPTIEAGETLALRKKRKIVTASTRTYYAGEHLVEVQVAGVVLADDSFRLKRGSRDIA